MRGGDLQAAEDLRHVEFFPNSQLAPAQYLYRHENPSRKANTKAVTTTTSGQKQIKITIDPVIAGLQGLDSGRDDDVDGKVEPSWPISIELRSS